MSYHLILGLNHGVLLHFQMLKAPVAFTTFWGFIRWMLLSLRCSFSAGRHTRWRCCSFWPVLWSTSRCWKRPRRTQHTTPKGQSALVGFRTATANLWNLFRLLAFIFIDLITRRTHQHAFIFWNTWVVLTTPITTVIHLSSKMLYKWGQGMAECCVLMLVFVRYGWAGLSRICWSWQSPTQSSSWRQVKSFEPSQRLSPHYIASLSASTVSFHHLHCCSEHFWNRSGVVLFLVSENIEMKAK